MRRREGRGGARPAVAKNHAGSPCVRLSVVREDVMPDFTVPEQHARGFSRIIGLSSDESDRLVKGLAQAKSINIKELTNLVSSALPLLSREESKEIVDAL